MAGFYVHVPFCKSKCVYCDFYSVTNTDLIAKYGKEILSEIEKVAVKYPDKIIETIYFGGGTPAVLPAALIGAIIDKIKQCFVCNLEEVTIEVNPTASNDIEEYSSYGINRISIGVQSLNDDVLKFLGRRHDASEAMRCVKKAKTLGYNVSADLMLGIPNSTDEDTKYAIKQLLPYVDHISAYILKVEENTPLYSMVKAKKVLLKDEDIVADSYEYAVKELEKVGLMQYEISNFSKPGKESKHNLKYWTLDDYIGVGPAAHSFVDGIRYYNTDNIIDYIDGHHSGNNYAVLEEKSDIDNVDEYIMLGLRLNKGVNIEECNRKYNINILERYKNSIEMLDDYIEIVDGYLRIKKHKLILQNSILLTLFGL